MSDPTTPISLYTSNQIEPVRSAARFIHPANLLTYVSFSLGVAAVVAAHKLGTPAAPAALLALGVLADIFDGRFARLFTRPVELQAFGAQIDSLSDAIVFGAAPVLVLYLTGATPIGAGAWLWWSAALTYLVCALTRLGAYNLTSESAQDFTGLPTPIGALILATFMLADSGFRASGLLLLVCGAAMVAPFSIARPRALGLGIVVVWAIAVVAAGLVSLSL